jgi:DNA-binding transcriptional LysR family regulator
MPETPLANGDALLRRLRLRHLQLLAILGSGTTLRAAAVQLSVTEPAVSKMIREIESACGTTLFVRSPRGIRANGSGAALIGRARGIVNEIAAAGREQVAIAEGASRALRIGAPLFIVAGPVAAAVTALKRALPRVQVSVREAGAKELLSGLADRSLDCIVCGIEPEFTDTATLSEFRIERLFPDHVCVIASLARAPDARRRLHWRDLTAARWVLPVLPAPLRRAFIQNYLNLGLHPPRPEIEASSAAAVAGFVRADPDLIGLVRIDGGLSEMERGGLRMLDVRPQIALTPVSVLYRDNHGVADEALVRLVAELKRVTADR